MTTTRTWEVLVVEDNGEVTAVYLLSTDLEALYEHLAEAMPDMRVLGCPKAI